MPLIKSGSREAVSQNIREMIHSGHPRAQAIAASLSNARKYGAKRATGGTAKFTKAEVHYTDSHGRSSEQCSKCKHYENRACEIVAGTINPEGWCNKFAKGYAAGGGLSMPFGERMAARSLWHEGF